MERKTFNESGEPTLLFLMGVGNRLDGASERWFIDQLTTAGYRVHAIQFSIDITDFQRAYRMPVQRVHDEQEPVGILGHSLGGLVAAFLETSAQHVYLSPWWGIHQGKIASWERWLVPRLPIQARILPNKTRREEIGVYLSDAAWSAIPRYISPVFITEVYHAQQTLPPIGDDARVFISLTDTIISLRTIGEAVRSDQVHLYDGGHQLFSAEGRQATIGDVLTVLPS